MNLPTNPVCVPRDVFLTAFACADTSVFDEGLFFAGGVSDAAGFVPCPCAYDTLTFPMPQTTRFAQPTEHFSTCCFQEPASPAPRSCRPDPRMRRAHFLTRSRPHFHL